MTDEQVADAACRYLSTAVGLNTLGARYGVSGATLGSLLRATGVPIRGSGHYVHPRTNEGASPATHRCTSCLRTREDGAVFARNRHVRGGLIGQCNQCRYRLYQQGRP